MLDKVPLVGSVSQGFGDNLAVQLPQVEAPDLKEASQNFVAMLYSYVFEQMRTSMSDEENGFFSGEQAQMFLGYLDQEIGRKLASSGGSGLAEQLVEQLIRNRPDLQEEEKQKQTGAVEALPGAEVGNQIRGGADAGDGQIIEISQQILEQIAKINSASS